MIFLEDEHVKKWLGPQSFFSDHVGAQTHHKASHKSCWNLTQTPIFRCSKKYFFKCCENVRKNSFCGNKREAAKVFFQSTNTGSRLTSSNGIVYIEQTEKFGVNTPSGEEPLAHRLYRMRNGTSVQEFENPRRNTLQNLKTQSNGATQKSNSR